MAIILTHSLSDAAASGGLSKMLCVKLEELFVLQIEEATSIDQVQTISDTMTMEFCQRVNEHRSINVADYRIRRTMQYITDYCTTKITLKELADIAGLSREYFSQKFHEQTGITVSEYILREKIKVAENMLTKTDLSLSEISSLLGFSSQAHFQRVFKRINNLTPMLYRISKKI